MQTGFSTNRAAAELSETLMRHFPLLTNGAAGEIVSKLLALLDAAIPTQNHSGGMSDR